MANKKAGYIQPQVPIEIGGLVYRHLLSYARARNQAPSEAINSILGDWAEGREGIRNPFAGAIPLLTQPEYRGGTIAQEEEFDDEKSEQERLAQEQEERIARSAGMW